MSRSSRSKNKPTFGQESRNATPSHFAVRLLGLLILVLAPWPGLGHVFAAWFTMFGNCTLAFWGIGDGVGAVFSVSNPSNPWDVVFSARGLNSTVLDTRILGYTPIAVYFALAGAMPMAWRARVKAALIGGAVVLLRLSLGIALPTARALGSLRWGSPSFAVAEVVWWTFINPPAMSYVYAAFAWWLGFWFADRRQAEALFQRVAIKT